MDFQFVKRHAAFLFPAIFIMCWFVVGMNYLPSDWAFHITGTQTPEYPPLSPLITNFFYRHGLIAVWTSALFIGIPYLLVLKITKDERYALAYVYLSGIPWTLAWGGFFGQAIIQVLMLLNLLTPLLWPFTMLIGLETHREAIGALGLSMAVWALIWFKGLLAGLKLPYQPIMGAKA